MWLRAQFDFDSVTIVKRVLRGTTLSIAITGDEPPSEFRIFTAGKVETTKGTFTFDDVAAKSVMAEYAAHGIDLMVDYDHASISSSFAPDPAQAGKAAAWFNLEVRSGELWAVNVRWTEPAAKALRAKEWRFMSPAFSTDEAGRITSVLNVAITNLPATRKLEPLMAASLVALGGTMDPEQAKKALALVESGDAEGALGMLKDLLAAAASGGAPAEEPAAEPAAELAEEPAAAAEEEEEDKPAVAAAVSRIAQLTGKATLGAAVEEIEVWRKSHVELAAATAKLAKDRAVLEADERDRLVAELVKAGESPATAWADPLVATNRTRRKPAEPWASMPIAALRTRAQKLSGRKDPPTPPESTPDGGGEGLTAEQARICKEAGITATQFLSTKKTHGRTGS